MSMNDLQKVIASHYSEQQMPSFTPSKRKTKTPDPELPSDILSFKKNLTISKKEKTFQISNNLKQIIQRTTCTLKIVHSKLFEYIKINGLQKGDRIVVDQRLGCLFVGMNDINVFDITNPKVFFV
jgi:chromatin remodeling complex protein RSC6